MSSLMEVPLAQHEITQEDEEAVLAALRGKLLTRGPKHFEFEKRIAEYVGTRYAIATSSGTTALHTALLALGVGKNSIVITTPLSFVASSNAIIHAGANVQFVDVEPATFQVDPNKVEEMVRACRREGDPVKAILAVDLFGYIADWDALRDIASRHDLRLIEDSCEALGSFLSNDGERRMAGSLADVGAFGFFPNKQITTGEGGMIVTNNADVNRLARMIKNHGQSPDDPWHAYKVLGYNFHMNEMTAALGLSQLSRIEQIVARRTEIASGYNVLLSDVPEITVPPVMRDGRISRFVYVIELPKSFRREDRSMLMGHMRDRGIMTREYFPCIHHSPFYQQLFRYPKGTFPVAEGFSERSLALPFFTEITGEQMRYVVESLKDGLHIARRQQ